MELGGLLIFLISGLSFSMMTSIWFFLKLKKQTEVSERLKKAFEGTNDMFWDLNLATGKIDYSPRFCSLMGFQQEEVPPQAKFWTSRVHPDDIFNLNRRLKSHFSRKTPDFECEFRLKSKSGDWKWLLARGKVHKWDKDGRPVRMLGAHTDISRQKNMDEKLLKSRTQFESLMTFAPVGICLTDMNGSFSMINRWWSEIAGVKEEKVLGLPWFDVVDSEDKGKVLSRWYSLSASETSFSMEFRVRRPGGDRRWVLANFVPWMTDGGRLDGYIGSLQDVTDLKNALLEADFYRSALDQAAITAMTDAKGRIIHANDRFCEISGYEREELLGRDHRILNSGLMPDGFFGNLWKTIREGETWKGEICNRTKHGSLYWVDSTIVPLMDSFGHPISYIAIRYDITPSKIQQENLSQALKQAETASLAKNQFLAMISHELRTPLNGILGMSSVLCEHSLSFEQLDLVTTIRECSEGLLQIVNDILDYSKVEAGKVHLEKAPFQIQDCVEEALMLVNLKAKEKNLDLDFKIARNTPLSLVGDCGRIRQVLLNLLSNAIKFTEKGKVRVRISSSKLNDNLYRFKFSVADTGIGIPQDQMKHLFKPFSQLDESVWRKFGGTGLGLSICKQFIELMGGQVRVRSRVGKGSIFSFTIQAQEEKGSRPIFKSERTLSKLAPLNDRMKILVVDDNAVNLKLVLLFLEKLGLRADRAGNGLEALKSFSAQNYDLILLDVNMPEMSGLEVCQKIRDMNDVKQPTIIAVTANAYDEDKMRCKQVGMDGFLAKPFGIKDLASEIARCIGEVSLTSEKNEGLIKDRNIKHEIVHQFMKSKDDLISGLYKAIQDSDLSQVEFSAHMLKGTLALFGFGVLRSKLENIENEARFGSFRILPGQLEALKMEVDQACSEIEAMGQSSSKVG